MLINTDAYPKIMEAFHTIDKDTNGPAAICSPICDVPDRWKPYLTRISMALGSLRKDQPAPESPPLSPHVKPDSYMDSEWFAFCAGDSDEVQAISNRTIDMELAAGLLRDYYDDFNASEDPYQEALKNRIEYLERVNDTDGVHALQLELR